MQACEYLTLAYLSTCRQQLLTAKWSQWKWLRIHTWFYISRQGTFSTDQESGTFQKQSYIKQTHFTLFPLIDFACQVASSLKIRSFFNLEEAIWKIFTKVINLYVNLKLWPTISEGFGVIYLLRWISALTMHHKNFDLHTVYLKPQKTIKFKENVKFKPLLMA